MAQEVAPGGPGQPELQCVGSTGGHAIHLLDPVAGNVLCCGLRSGQIKVGADLTPFELVGCRRCASEADRRGYHMVLGFDGSQITLAGFTPAAFDGM